ncbi:MAG: WD40 repeat domain-containing protein, partial [Pseudomonadota bacterium]
MLSMYPLPSLLRRLCNALLTISLCIVADGAHSAGESGLRLMSPQAHSLGVSAIAIDGRAELVATGGSDQRILLWHLPSARQWRSLAGHGAAITNLAFSPDGSLLASGDEQGGVRVWRIADGASLCQWKNSDLSYASLPYPQAAVSVGWVGHDEVWSVGDRGYARQWSLAECAETSRIALHSGAVRGSLRDRDGWILAAPDAVLRLNAQGIMQWRIPIDSDPLRLIRRTGGGAVSLSDGRVLEFDRQGRLDRTSSIQFDGGHNLSIAALSDGWVRWSSKFGHNNRFLRCHFP